MSQAMFKLFGSIQKVEDNDDGTITVFGVASSGARDHANEIVAPEAMKAALPDYSKFPALREMHQPLAAGRVMEADVDDDGITNIEALVVDPVAISKVKTGVYSGFSIGGKITKRDPSDRSIITGLRLIEISLVDSPCNPDAVLSMWKADTMSEYTPAGDEVVARAKKLADTAGTKKFRDFLFEAREELVSEHMLEKGELAPPAEVIETPAVVEPPVVEEPKEAAAEVVTVEPVVDEEDKEAAATTGEPDEDDGAGEGAGDLVEPEAKTAAANPLLTALEEAIAKGGEVVEAAAPEVSVEQPEPFADLGKAAIALKGIGASVSEEEMAPGGTATVPDSVAKGLYSVSRFADLLQSFAYLQESSQCEAEYEGDNSPIPAQLAEAVSNLGSILVAMAQEEVAELLAGMTGSTEVEIIYIGDECAMAASIVDAVKANTDLMAKVAERVAPAEAIEDEAQKAARIAELESENETLSKALEQAAPAVEELTKKFQARFDELNTKFEALDKTVLPAKTAGPAVARVVAKTEDSAGAGAVTNERFGDLTTEQFDKAWNALSEEERGMILIKASLANPQAIAAR